MILCAAISEPYVISVGASGRLFLYNLSSQSSAAPLALSLPAVSSAVCFLPDRDEQTERCPVLVAAGCTLQVLLPVPFKHHVSPHLKPSLRAKKQQQGQQRWLQALLCRQY